MTIPGDEELGPERVTKGEPEKRLPGTLKTVMEHLPPIFAERLFPDEPAIAYSEIRRVLKHSLSGATASPL